MNKNINVGRRQFMARMGFLSSLALTYPAATLAELRSSKSKRVVPDWAQDSVWQTISQVQEILFPPADDIPGAGDIGAHIYLYNAIETPTADGEDKEFIYQGVKWLEDLTQQRKQKSFIRISMAEQEEMLQIIVQSRAGRNWISTLLTYLLEALLTDPVYGGNRDKAGWLWLQHQPGYPTPGADKTWHNLLQRRYKT